MIAWGISAWLGWYRLWARGHLGNIIVPLGISGVGWLLIGVAGMTRAGWLVLLAVAFMLAGVLLYVVSPHWLLPPWYRELKNLRRTQLP